MRRNRAADFLTTFDAELAEIYEIFPSIENTICALLGEQGSASNDIKEKPEKLLKPLLTLSQNCEGPLFTGSHLEIAGFSLTIPVILNAMVQNSDLLSAIHIIFDTLDTSESLTNENLRLILQPPNLLKPEYHINPENNALSHQTLNRNKYTSDLFAIFTKTHCKKIFEIAILLEIAHKNNLLYQNNATQLIQHIINAREPLVKLEQLKSETLHLSTFNKEWLEIIFDTKHINKDILENMTTPLLELEKLNENSIENFDKFFRTIKQKIPTGPTIESTKSYHGSINNAIFLFTREIYNFSMFTSQLNNHDLQENLRYLMSKRSTFKMKNIYLLCKTGIKASELLTLPTEKLKLAERNMDNHTSQFIAAYLGAQFNSDIEDKNRETPLHFYSGFIDHEVIEKINEITGALAKLNEANYQNFYDFCSACLTLNHEMTKEIFMHHATHGIASVNNFQTFSFSDEEIAELNTNKEHLYYFSNIGIPIHIFMKIDKSYREIFWNHVNGNNVDLLVYLLKTIAIDIKLILTEETISLITEISDLIYDNNDLDYTKYKEKLEIIRSHFTGKELSTQSSDNILRQLIALKERFTIEKNITRSPSFFRPQPEAIEQLQGATNLSMEFSQW